MYHLAGRMLFQWTVTESMFQCIERDASHVPRILFWGLARWREVWAQQQWPQEFRLPSQQDHRVRQRRVSAQQLCVFEVGTLVCSCSLRMGMGKPIVSTVNTVQWVEPYWCISDWEYSPVEWRVFSNLVLYWCISVHGEVGTHDAITHSLSAVQISLSNPASVSVVARSLNCYSLGTLT